MSNLKKYLAVGVTAVMLSAGSAVFSSEAMAQHGHGGGGHGGGGFHGGGGGFHGGGFGGRGFRGGGYGRGYGFRGGYGGGWRRYGYCSPWRAARGWCGGYYGYPY
jgi:hypothetical protein